jgi:hypothetical protein
MKKLPLFLLLSLGFICSSYADDTPIKETAASLTVERLQSTDCENKDITEELERHMEEGGYLVKGSESYKAVSSLIEPILRELLCRPIDQGIETSLQLMNDLLNQ